jgi:hypothetical protein
VSDSQPEEQKITLTVDVETIIDTAQEAIMSGHSAFTDSYEYLYSKQKDAVIMAKMEGSHAMLEALKENLTSTQLHRFLVVEVPAEPQEEEESADDAEGPDETAPW